MSFQRRADRIKFEGFSDQSDAKIPTGTAKFNPPRRTDVCQLPKGLLVAGLYAAGKPERQIYAQPNAARGIEGNKDDRGQSLTGLPDSVTYRANRRPARRNPLVDYGGRSRPLGFSCLTFDSRKIVAEKKAKKILSLKVISEEWLNGELRLGGIEIPRQGGWKGDKIHSKS